MENNKNVPVDDIENIQRLIETTPIKQQ